MRILHPLVHKKRNADKKIIQFAIRDEPSLNMTNVNAIWDLIFFCAVIRIFEKKLYKPI